jgi:hypothetical protein
MAVSLAPKTLLGASIPQYTIFVATPERNRPLDGKIHVILKCIIEK